MVTVSQKKLDPFSFEHNFGKCCQILIILSLLQTEINYDQMYFKIYHHTSNLLVTLNVTDMDKLNIVSSQAILEMFSFSMDIGLRLDVFLATGQ